MNEMENFFYLLKMCIFQLPSVRDEMVPESKRTTKSSSRGPVAFRVRDQTALN